MEYERAITRLMLLIIAIVALASCVAPDPTVSQYVDEARGIVCYTYGSSGISCVKD